MTVLARGSDILASLFLNASLCENSHPLRSETLRPGHGFCGDWKQEYFKLTNLLNIHCSAFLVGL